MKRTHEDMDGSWQAPYFIVFQHKTDVTTYHVTRELTEFECDALKAADGFSNSPRNSMAIRLAGALFADSDEFFDGKPDLTPEQVEEIGPGNKEDYLFSRQCPKDKRGTLASFEVKIVDGKRPSIEGRCKVVHFCDVD